jgi:predicted nucleotidyltransferase
MTANPTASVKAGHNGAMAIALTQNQREAITEACRRHQVARLHAFGSVVGSHYQPGVSDIDLLVEFQPCDAGALYKAYFSLLNELRQQLPAPVDLVMADAVRNPYVKASIEADKQILYAT